MWRGFRGQGYATRPYLVMPKPFIEPITLPGRWVASFQAANSEYGANGNSSLNLGTNSYALECFVRTTVALDDNNDRYGLWGKGNYAVSGSTILHIRGGDYNGILGRIKWGAGGGDLVSVTPDADKSSILADGGWHHLVFVRDTENTQARLYLGGELVGSNTDANWAADLSGSASSEMAIGKEGSGAYYVSADLSETRLLIFGDAVPSDYTNSIPDHAASPYSISGRLDAWLDADRDEALSETDFATHAKWDVSNDIDDSGGNAHYTWSANQTSTLTQTAGNRAKAGDNSKYYELVYTVAVTTAPDGDFALSLTTDFANSSTALPFTAGTHRVIFKSASNASTGDFVIEAVSGTDTGGEFTIDDISLRRVGLLGYWTGERNGTNEQFKDETSNANHLDCKSDIENTWREVSAPVLLF